MLIFTIAGVAVAARARGYHAASLVAWASAVLAVGAKTETTTLARPLALFLGAHRFPVDSGRGWSVGGFIDKQALKAYRQRLRDLEGEHRRPSGFRVP